MLFVLSVELVSVGLVIVQGIVFDEPALQFPSQL